MHIPRSAVQHVGDRTVTRSGPATRPVRRARGAPGRRHRKRHRRLERCAGRRHDRDRRKLLRAGRAGSTGHHSQRAVAPTTAIPPTSQRSAKPIQRAGSGRVTEQGYRRKVDSSRGFACEESRSFDDGQDLRHRGSVSVPEHQATVAAQSAGRNRVHAQRVR